MEVGPLPLMTSPHELRPNLATPLLKKMTRAQYQPGDVILDASSNASPQVVVVLSGEVECDLDPASTDPNASQSQLWTSERDMKSADLGIHTPGEPFTSVGVVQPRKKGSDKYVLTPAAGAAIGEWLLLSMNLSQIPRVVAHSAVSAVTLSEDALVAAMQQDDQVVANLWWSRCQRETFCFLRKLEPFCWWQPSKLWRWTSLGKHAKVSEGRGILGATAPFVILLQGRCHLLIACESSWKEGTSREFMLTFC